jgi:magnesium chelatase subunit I
VLAAYLETVMSIDASDSMVIMPYSMIFGQEQLKLALELAFIAPRIEGVLLSGHRGTGKSTAVRAFATMVYERLPVTLPINATEDRVIGDWQIDHLLKGHTVEQLGLIEQADGTVLYIDEVNLLDDHIVNIILDVTSTGRLIGERNRPIDKEVRFTMVGTMNPSEGGLRPQLLDRFGLMVHVVTPDDEGVRIDILQAVLDYDAARTLKRANQQGETLTRLETIRAQDRDRKVELVAAQTQFPKVALPREMAARCVRIAERFQVEGHRGDYVMALAARAHAALRGSTEVTSEDLLAVAQLALQHRRPQALQSVGSLWSEQDDDLVYRLSLGESA